MSLIAKNTGGGDFEQVPEGSYVARCFKIIDLGTQTSEWNGEKRERHKVLISWEILDDGVRMKDGRPFAISKRYTVSLNEKAQLRADLQAWRGKRFTDEELEGFDLKNVLGAYCSIQVLHEEKNGTTYENVVAIMATREKPKPVNDNVYFDISDPDMTLFETFGDRLKDTIRSAPEWGQGAAQDEQSHDTAANKPKDVAPTDIDEAPIDLSEIPF